MQLPKTDGRRRAPLFLRLVTPQFRVGRLNKLQPAPNSVFILSTGRTGTVYLADLLNQLDGVVALHEPKPSRVLNAWTTAFLEGRISVDFMTAALAGKRRKTFKNVHAKRLYVESNNFIAGFADALGAVFDDPVVVHLVRDPRDFITSLTNRGDDRGIRKLFNKYVPYWAYVPEGVKKRQLNALTRAAYRWVAINEYLDDFGTRSRNCHFFKFEDVFDREHPDQLHELLRAIGLTNRDISRLDFAAKSRPAQPRFSLLDRPSDSANRSKHAAMAPWREWTAAERQEVDRICGPLMRRYGYGSEPEWQVSAEGDGQ
ncbi:MAG TPA: hypothetical protein VFH39_03175 [Candidatus Saccharimonadales bacterium]|nr:hypothetical protein [Candidatus Saccharimonadales bacterium]